MWCNFHFYSLSSLTNHIFFPLFYFIICTENVGMFHFKLGHKFIKMYIICTVWHFWFLFSLFFLLFFFPTYFANVPFRMCVLNWICKFYLSLYIGKLHLTLLISFLEAFVCWNVNTFFFQSIYLESNLNKTQKCSRATTLHIFVKNLHNHYTERADYIFILKIKINSILAGAGGSVKDT